MSSSRQCGGRHPRDSRPRVDRGRDQDEDVESSEPRPNPYNRTSVYSEHLDTTFRGTHKSETLRSRRDSPRRLTKEGNAASPRTDAGFQHPKINEPGTLPSLYDIPLYRIGDTTAVGRHDGTSHVADHGENSVREISSTTPQRDVPGGEAQYYALPRSIT